MKRNREKFFKNIVEEVDEGIVIVDLEENIVFANPASSNVFGIPHEELIGRNLSAFLTLKDFFKVRKQTQIRRSRRKSVYEIEIIKHGGGKTPILVTATPNADEKGEITTVLGVFRDISIIKETERDLLLRDSILNAAAQCSKLFLSDRDFPDILENCLEIIGKASKTDRCFIFMASEEKGFPQRCSLTNEWKRPGFETFLTEDKFAGVEISNYEEFFEPLMNNRAVSFTEFEMSEALRAELKIFNISSFLATPVFVSGRFWGFVGYAEHFRQRIWTDGEKSGLVTFSAMLSAAIENNRTMLKLLEEKQKAKKASEEKTRFIANVTHEIRTPLNSIFGIVNILKDEGLSVDAVKQLDIIQNAAGNIITLLDDTRDISKIEAGRITLHYTVIDIREYCSEICDMMKAEAEKKGLKISFSIAANVPEKIIGDTTRIKEILLNFMSNAVKFTATGFITLGVRIVNDKRISEYRKKLSFYVSDTGPGISGEQLGKIFSRYEQGGVSVSKKFSGSGLGLHISQKLAELMGGKITVESEISQGTVFYFTAIFDLPGTSIKKENKKQTSLSCYPVKTDKFSILLVEDNPDSRFVFKKAVKSFYPAADIYLASDARKGIEMMEKYRPSIVFMDIQMPGMNGIEMYSAVKKRCSSENMPQFVAVTAYADDETIESMKKSGIEEYMMKPIDFADVRSLINRYVFS